MNVRGGACAILRFMLSLPMACVLKSHACLSSGGNQDSGNMLLNVSNLSIRIAFHCPDSKLRDPPPFFAMVLYLFVGISYLAMICLVLAARSRVAEYLAFF